MKNTMEDNQVVGLEPSNLSYSDNNLNNIKDVEECNQDTIKKKKLVPNALKESWNMQNAFRTQAVTHTIQPNT